ncbi:MAG: hypothetical protein J6R86_03350 [Lentisphaeria bacterium]|nr:hypothetical protein [Lentisphaeria bacterium]
MKNVKRVMRAFVGILLIVLAIIVWNKHHAQYRNVEEARKIEQELNALPDYDYVSEIKSLIKEKRYGEAIILCEDVQKLGLPCAPEVAELKTEAEKESKKFWNRFWKSGRAFITGNPDGSIEEIGASVVSDMVIYGDVRDLIKQGWFKITKQETDPLLAALAAAGLVTEFVDVADWCPAVLKAFRKIGAVSAKMADSLVAMFKNVAKTGKINKGTKTFFKNTKKMVDSAGLIRTKNMFKYADNAGDLALLAKKSADNSALTHVVAKHAGKQTVEVLKESTPGFLKVVARKGRLAVRFMKVYHKHHAVIEKTFWQKIPKGLVNGFSAVSGLIGLILLLAGAVPLFANKRK